MTELTELAAAVPALLRDRIVPFTNDRVRITSADARPAQDGSVLVAVTYATEQSHVGQYEFLVDDSWGFGSTQDIVDQLLIDLVEHLDTSGAVAGPRASDQSPP